MKNSFFSQDSILQNNDFETHFKIGELSKITGVKTGTIRFYERCGFLEPAERLHNRYRIFNMRHIYQVHICRLVFGGFVNKRLRRISLRILEAARSWDLDAYRETTKCYLQAVEEDIAGTRRAIATVTEKLQGIQNLPSKPVCCVKDSFNTDLVYSKKQAAELIGVTPEAIRNWERNGLLEYTELYRRRFYSQWALERMYIIRLLLDNGYSMMAIRSFFVEFDVGDRQEASDVLINPGERENLIYRADRYLETLINEKEKAKKLCDLLDEMCFLPGIQL